jgi:hypothetical protein
LKNFNEMKSIDIEKYKSAWQNVKSIDDRKLSENEISRFMNSSSKSFLKLFRRGLIFDIGFKTSLIFSIVFLFFLMPNQISILYVNLTMLLIASLGIVWQMKVLLKVPNNKIDSPSIIDNLRDNISFYYKYYINAIYVGALSTTLFFLIGSIYYFYFKYHEIPPFQPDDFIVMGIGIILSFGLSALAQLKQNKYSIYQLEKSLKEIEEKNFTEQSVKSYKSSRLKNIILISLFILAGLLLLIYLIIN